eukprot:SAG31_NODE_6546_length_1981_cov_2.579171_1_plen_410_part_00
MYTTTKFSTPNFILILPRGSARGADRVRDLSAPRSLSCSLYVNIFAMSAAAATLRPAFEPLPPEEAKPLHEAHWQQIELQGFTLVQNAMPPDLLVAARAAFDVAVTTHQKKPGTSPEDVISLFLDPAADPLFATLFDNPSVLPLVQRAMRARTRCPRYPDGESATLLDMNDGQYLPVGCGVTFQKRTGMGWHPDGEYVRLTCAYPTDDSVLYYHPTDDSVLYSVLHTQTCWMIWLQREEARPFTQAAIGLPLETEPILAQLTTTRYTPVVGSALLCQPSSTSNPDGYQFNRPAPGVPQVQLAAASSIVRELAADSHHYKPIVHLLLQRHDKMHRLCCCFGSHKIRCAGTPALLITVLLHGESFGSSTSAHLNPSRIDIALVTGSKEPMTLWNKTMDTGEGKRMRLGNRM